MIVEEAIELAPADFDAMYSRIGRPNEAGLAEMTNALAPTLRG
jgi:hypothetical protein